MKNAITMTSMVGVGAVLALGCVGAPGEPSSDPQLTQPDFTEKFSSEGLTLETSDSDHLTGRFERNGVQLRFDFQKNGDTRHVRFERSSGEPLLESTLKDGVDSSTLLGGKAYAQGEVFGAPTIQGQSDAFAELSAAPEALLLPELKEALIAGHVDEAFWSAEAPTAAGGLTTQRWFDGTYWHLSSGESIGFWSWSFWGWTTVVIASERDPANGFASAWFQVDLAGRRPEGVSGRGMQSYRRQWWGAHVTVGNDQIPLCNPDGSGCGSVTMIMRHY
jgi:hypothetical protein